MFAKPDEPVKPAQTTSQTAGSAAAAPPVPGQIPAVPQIGPPEGTEPPEPPPAEAATIALPFDRFVATFSSACGGLTSWKLTDERHPHDTTPGEPLPARAPM